MFEKLLISVIIPVFNAESYLNRCLDTVLAQTYQELEILLINDGSTDHSGEICDEYASKDKRVKIIHKINSGVSATRNVGLANATGEYILFVDSDDYLEPGMVESLVGKAVENNCDIVMCGYYIQTGNSAVLEKMDYLEYYGSNSEVIDKLIARFYTGENTGLNSLWNKLIRRKIYQDNCVKFNTDLKRAEDMWFVFECLKHTERLSFINEAFYHYVQNPDSIMHILYLDQYRQWKYTRTRLLDENIQFGFDLDMPVFYANFLQNCIVHIKQLLLHKETELSMCILQDSLLHEATRYAKRTDLRFHVKWIARLIHKKKYTKAINILKIWNCMKRG